MEAARAAALALQASGAQASATLLEALEHATLELSSSRAREASLKKEMMALKARGQTMEEENRTMKQVRAKRG